MTRFQYALHILERFQIHVFSSTSLYLLALFGFWGLEIHVSWWPPVPGVWGLIFPAVVVFMAVASREIFDIAKGGWIGKSIIDWFSWAVGLTVSVYGLHKIAPRLFGFVTEAPLF